MAGPGIRDASFVGSDFRANFKQILANRPDLARYGRGRMVAAAPTNPPAAPGYAQYYAGTVVGLVTANGQYAPYASGNTDGSQTPVGVLFYDVETDQYGNNSEAVIFLGGAELFKDMLIGLDANAITALGAKSRVESGVNLIYFNV